MDKKLTGKIGEKIAETFLKSRGYKIIGKNYHSKWGELDIIAVDHSDKNLSIQKTVFIEVKTRTTDIFGEPEEAISALKKLKIIKTALHFMNQASENVYASWRIDVIAIKLNKELKPKKIIHIKNI